MKNLFCALFSGALLLSLSLQGIAGTFYNLKESPYTTYIAQQPGDILTVIVEESAKTKNNGKSLNERKNSQEFSLSKFFFPHFQIPTGLDDSNGDGDPAGLAWKSNNRFEGKGQNDSESNMYTVMQVRVIEEIREGHFYIKGFRHLNIDGKEKKLFVSGVIRQRDIAPDNTILSSRIADAVVEIEGDMSKEVLRPGLIHRLFNFIL